MKKRALVTGIYGQDGSYLTELLVGADYEVHGVARLPLSKNALGIKQVLDGHGVLHTVHQCNIIKYSQVRDLIQFIKPTEIFHLAATHFSSQSKEGADFSTEIDMYVQNSHSTLNFLQAIRENSPETRMVYAGSCLMFDASDVSPQRETTPFKTKSLYGATKIAGFELVKFYREVYNLHASTAILYNHESPRRPTQFVSRKIVNGVFEILSGKLDRLILGDLEAIRDWGFAKDYAHAMWLMAQQDNPDDYIVATGEGRSVREFIEYVAKLSGLRDWQEHVYVNPTLLRKYSPALLIGDAAHVRTKLGWHPSVSFEELIQLMVDFESLGNVGEGRRILE